jgi:hypothetical protein
MLKPHIPHSTLNKKKQYMRVPHTGHIRGQALDKAILQGSGLSIQ